SRPVFDALWRLSRVATIYGLPSRGDLRVAAPGGFNRPRAIGAVHPSSKILLPRIDLIYPVCRTLGLIPCRGQRLLLLFTGRLVLSEIPIPYFRLQVTNAVIASPKFGRGHPAVLAASRCDSVRESTAGGAQ